MNPFTKPRIITGLILGLTLIGIAVSGGLEIIFQFIPLSKILAYPVWMAWIGIAFCVLWGSALIYDFSVFWRNRK